MYKTSKKQVWIGELRTARGTSIVIRDNQLPEASSGRIYLYNAQRNAIVEYVEDIVMPNLHDIDEMAIKAAEKQYGANWKETRAAFMGKHQSLLDLDNASTATPAKKSKAEPELEAEPEGYADDYDDDWSDDDYDD